MGSLQELDTHLEIASRLGYVSKTDEEQVVLKTCDVGRMLARLIQSLTHTRP
jgi:four helix bundle protein